MNGAEWTVYFGNEAGRHALPKHVENLSVCLSVCHWKVVACYCGNTELCYVELFC
jgi:hypothetical protein